MYYEAGKKRLKEGSVGEFALEKNSSRSGEGAKRMPMISKGEAMVIVAVSRDSADSLKDHICLRR